MEEKNMTALVSCFARCYHYKNNEYHIFNDYFAEKILSEEEYNTISKNMIQGINFFNSDFIGNEEDALRWIVDNQLSPSVLGRSAFCEFHLANAVKLGCKQYLIFASGYDTFAYRNTFQNLMIYEIDRKEMIDDKIKRLQNGNIDYSKVNYLKCNFEAKDWIHNILDSSFKQKELSFSSLLGISYYLTKNDFINLIRLISSIVCKGSSIVFDYPTMDNCIQTSLNEKLAEGANEEMRSKYSFVELTKILEDNHFLIYEHLDAQEMTETYFSRYNTLNPKNQILAPKGVCYCLAVKQE